MLKISQLGPNDNDQPVLRLEGQVTGPWIEELRRVCKGSIRSGDIRTLVLDLGGVSFLATEAIDLFRALHASGVRFTNGSAFITEQLRGVADGEG